MASSTQECILDPLKRKKLILDGGTVSYVQLERCSAAFQIFLGLEGLVHFGPYVGYKVACNLIIPTADKLAELLSKCPELLSKCPGQEKLKGIYQG